MVPNFLTPKWLRNGKFKAETSIQGQFSVLQTKTEDGSFTPIMCMPMLSWCGNMRVVSRAPFQKSFIFALFRSLKRNKVIFRISPNSCTKKIIAGPDSRAVYTKQVDWGMNDTWTSSCSELTTILWLPPSEVARENQEKVSSWMLTIFASGLQHRAYLTCGQDHTWSWQIGNKKTPTAWSVLSGLWFKFCSMNIFKPMNCIFSLCTHIFFVWWIIWSKYYRLFGFTHQHIWL